MPSSATCASNFSLSGPPPAIHKRTLGLLSTMAGNAAITASDIFFLETNDLEIEAPLHHLNNQVHFLKH